MCFYPKTLPLTINLLLLMFMVSCSSPTYLDSDHQKEVVSIWEGFTESWHRQDAASCASIYLEDGLNIPPGFPENQGREKIASFYDFLFSENISSVYQHKILDLTSSGEELIERGEFQVDWVKNDQSTWSYKARTLTHWTRDEQDNWKIKTLIFNQAPEN